MDIKSKLNNELLKQTFAEEQLQPGKLDECKQIASTYARIENSIAVLSDMRANISYIYYGGMAERLGIAQRNSSKTIHSIWEEEIFSRIHPDDLLEKHLQELRFLHFLRNIPEEERSDYYITSRIRMKDNAGEYIPISHKMFYIASHSNGSIWLAICLYNLAESTNPSYAIINSANGQRLEPEQQTCNNILSSREIDVLQLIEQGKLSKEIASILSISINTVNRHRQNILEKLQVTNSIQACLIAKGLGVI